MWGTVYGSIRLPAMALALLTAHGTAAVAAPASDARAAADEANSGSAVQAAVTRTRCANPNAIGVSRTVTIDPKRGHLFGTQQYKMQDPLQDGEVVLTFDDGPLRRYTKRVLAALEAECTKATFFAVGRMAISDPDMLRKVAAKGHTIAHHSWSHMNQNRNSFQRDIAEFELGLSAVETVIGGPTAPFFRFPYLADPKRMRQYLAQRGFGIFSIDIDSYDWKSKSATRVRRQILRGLKSRGKGILLFHDIQRATAGALPDLLRELRERRYKIVHFVPAEPATTLPEYDKEAQRLLETRNWRRRSRPIKTSFRFDPSKVADTKPRNPASRPKASRAARDDGGRSQGAAQNERQSGATVQSKPVGHATVVRRRKAPDPKPDWRDTVFQN